MTANIEKEVLEGFIEEARGYLPAIRLGIEHSQTDPGHPDGLKEAHRHAHTIKGAASMVGLTGLSHITYYVEDALEAISAGQLAMNEAAATWLSQTLAQIEQYLDSALTGSLDERTLLTEVTQSYRRLRGLPVEEDETAMAELLATVSPASPAVPSTTEPPELETLSEELLSEEMAPELLEAFYLEAEDHLHQISLSLAELEKEPDREDLLQNVRRSVHTLKGAAGTVGLRAMADLTHRFEDLLDHLYERKLTLDPDVMHILFASNDALEDLVTDGVDPVAMQETIQTLYAGYELLLESISDEDIIEPRSAEPAAEDGVDEVDTVSYLQTIPPEQLAPVPATTPPPTRSRQVEVGDMVRVPIDRLDELIRLVGELVITRTAFEQRMGDLIQDVEELRPSIERLRRVSNRLEIEYEARTLGGGTARLIATPEGALPEQNGEALPVSELAQSAIMQTHDFDELEFDRYTEFHLLSRELAETTSDVNSVGNSLNLLIGDFDSILNRQGRLSTELQEKLMRTRMVPLSSLIPRFQRAVRVVARKQDKQVELVTDGGHIELDKTVLEEMADPLLHILRNAVDHGIEPPALRRVIGKSEHGQIKLHAYHEGSQVVIQISDDGAGLEPQLIRSKAVSAGYFSEAEAARMSEEELRSLIFLPGFSTAGEVSEVSGRGVGLDVVKANVNKLKGTIALESVSGQGAIFTIRLPRTLAVTRSLMIKAHRETFAIPLNTVSQILRLDRDAYDQVGQEPVIRIGEEVYPIFRLGEVLQLPHPPEETEERLPVLIINAAGRRVAVVVDEILQGREIVIKSLGHHLRWVRGVMGATLMGDGRVVLILNPIDLFGEPAAAQIEVRTPSRRPSVSERDHWKIMIVDDSISVRRVVSKLIQNAGWQPIMAKDGLEALEMIQSGVQPPDLILLDIEMPRMDGYEVTAALRSQDAYRTLPIVMLTSRAGEKHRRKAFDMGASEYVVKPYQDETLVNLIRRLVQASKETASA